MKVVSFNGDSEDELLRTAACLEEHFPHSMAKAVVDAAKKKSLDHEEKHSKVEYIVVFGFFGVVCRAAVVAVIAGIGGRTRFGRRAAVPCAGL